MALSTLQGKAEPCLQRHVGQVPDDDTSRGGTIASALSKIYGIGRQRWTT